MESIRTPYERGNKRKFFSSLWSSSIERVEWVAERRLTRQNEHENDERKKDWCDKMSNKRIFLRNYTQKRRSRTRYNTSLCKLSVSFSTLLIAIIALQSAGNLFDLHLADASLIIGDSAIEIQEVQDENNNNQQHPQQQQAQPILNGAQVHQHSPTNFLSNDEQGTSAQFLQIEQPNDQQMRYSNGDSNNNNNNEFLKSNQQQDGVNNQRNNINRLPSGPLPPINKHQEDITDGDKRSRGNHDYDIQELKPARSDERRALSEILAAPNDGKESGDGLEEKQITGKVVDFELTPAGGHNKAKIKKKKKKKKIHVEKAEAYKKWNKKHKAEKKAMEKKEKEHVKKKKEEGKKKKKKWGLHVQGLKKKGNFKKKKWGKKVKKGKGVKKGKKGKKFLKDKGHKNTGFKTVYHKEEWGKSAKWHDIKREKKWDEKSKKWKKKWKKEKGKKYKGDHMKKFEKQKKEGKKYKKAKKEQHKKFKKEKFEAGKKKKMEEHKKKKEGGEKKMMKEEKKKKKKKL